MAEPFLGEIRLFTFDFPPTGWALCDGQLLQISQYQALYAVLGTTFGGDGQTTFALPNLQGRVPAHRGPNVTYGQAGGSAGVALSAQQMLQHTHQFVGSLAPADKASPAGNVWAAQELNPYGTAPDMTMNGAALAQTGGEAHENRQPYLVTSFCIALQGIFPSRN